MYPPAGFDSRDRSHGPMAGRPHPIRFNRSMVPNGEVVIVFGSQRHALRVTILVVCLSLLAAVVPHAARAIQLHWSSGATDTSFTADMRCMLVVQADSAEVTLPPSWRVMWTADSSRIQFTALDSLAACQTDTADVSRIDPPSTPADSAAGQITAHLCSAGEPMASTAYFLVDLVGGSHGKLKVVALDPADSNAVIESNDVTYNGGVDGDYAPLVLRASSVHQSLQLQVIAVGAGLNRASALSTVAPNASWSLPLTIASRTDTSLIGVASVAALLPPCLASVGALNGSGSSALLRADAELSPDVSGGGTCSVQYFEDLLPPPLPLHAYAIQPEDFSFTRGFVDSTTNRYALHLFYIRRSYYDMPADSNTKNIGHIWTSDFSDWHGPTPEDKPDTVALHVRPGKFDELHVWAPSIVQLGLTYHMFYAGVRTENGRNNQRIGVATSTNLNDWFPSRIYSRSVANTKASVW